MSSVRVAAIGDVHVGPDSDPVLDSELLAETADLLARRRRSHPPRHTG